MSYLDLKFELFMLLFLSPILRSSDIFGRYQIHMVSITNSFLILKISFGSLPSLFCACSSKEIVGLE